MQARQRVSREPVSQENSMSEWDLASALVPVSGGASGIGLAICQRLRAAGARPLLLDIDANNLKAAIDQVYGDVADRDRHGYVVDVRSSKAVDECFERIRGEHGVITHAVANAGVSVPAHVLRITDEQWQRAIEVNLNGVMYICRAASRQLVKAGQGAIVNIASIAGLLAKPERIAYASSKAAVVNLTRALALDLGTYGIRVNAVAPGVIRTPMQALTAQERLRAVSNRTALKRLGEAHEVADVVLFLLSNKASYVTGHTLTVDGGLTANYA